MQGQLESKKKIGGNHAFFLEIIKQPEFQKEPKYKTMCGIFSQIEHKLRINKFFEIDLTIKVNVKRERRFDRPTVIFKFKMRSKICAYIQL